MNARPAYSGNCGHYVVRNLSGDCRLKKRDLLILLNCNSGEQLPWHSITIIIINFRSQTFNSLCTDFAIAKMFTDLVILPESMRNQYTSVWSYSPLTEDDIDKDRGGTYAIEANVPIELKWAINWPKPSQCHFNCCHKHMCILERLYNVHDKIFKQSQSMRCFSISTSTDKRILNVSS